MGPGMFLTSRRVTRSGHGLMTTMTPDRHSQWPPRGSRCQIENGADNTQVAFKCVQCGHTHTHFRPDVNGSRCEFKSTKVLFYCASRWRYN